MNTSPFASLRRPALMGIVNVTPNSFSDGTLDPAAATARALQLVADGATLLDLGAEASSFFRAGVEPVPPDEQLRRLTPVLDLLLPQLPAHVRLSIDTRSAQVAAAALARGAHIINDISAGTHDPLMFTTVAQHNAGLILMHISPNYPATPTEDDPDILTTVRTYLHQRAAAATVAGIPAHHLALDPGIGFGKTMPDNWRLALRLQELRFGGQPYTLVLGISRKRFLETPPPAHLRATWTDLIRQLTPLAPPGSHPRDIATAALSALSEAHLHRLHEVTLTRSALTMI